MRITALAVLACAAAASPARADCPESDVGLRGVQIVTSAPTYDSTYVYFGTFQAAFDLPAGTLSMYQCCTLLHTWVDTRDAFDVTGVPPGTPVTLTAQLTVDCFVSTTGCGGSGCSGTVIDSLEHGADVDSQVHAVHLFIGREDFHDVLSIPVTIVAGTPEVIRCKIEGYRNPGGSHDSGGSGSIQFVGLPPGVSVISCQGYSSQPTPARKRTWGSLKVTYR